MDEQTLASMALAALSASSARGAQAVAPERPTARAAARWRKRAVPPSLVTVGEGRGKAGGKPRGRRSRPNFAQGEASVQVQFNTDDNIEGRDALAGRVEAEVAATLGRFADRITRVEVHLSDEDAGRSGGADKRCLMEARPAGRRPVAVTHQAATLEEAYGDAAKKLRNLLDSIFGRLDDTKGAASIRGDGML